MRADDLADEAAWALHTLDRFQQASVPLPDQSAARLVAALTLPPIRDLALAEHTRDTAETMCCLWRDLTRRTPRAQVGPVAELATAPGAAWHSEESTDVVYDGDHGQRVVRS